MFHKTAQSLLTSKTTSSLSQGSVTAGNRWSISEEIEGTGLRGCIGLKAGILNSTLEICGRDLSDSWIQGEAQKLKGSECRR